MKDKSVRTVVVTAAVLFVFALDSFAWTVSGDYYVVGVSGGSLSSGTGYSGAPSTKYDVATAEKPNWSEIAADTTVAAGSKKLRINGCVILDQIRSGLFASYEILEGSFLILNVESKSVFADGSKLVIPVGAKAQLLPGTWTLDGGKYWLTNGAKASGGTVVGSTDMDINGEFIENKVDSCWSDKNVLHNFNGQIGGTGSFNISGWGKQIYVSQPFSFSGDMTFNSPYGGFFFLASMSVSGKMNSVTMTGDQFTQKDNASWCAEGLVFGPPSKKPADSVELNIGTLSSTTANFSNGHRYGNNLIVYGGRRVHADTFTGNLHVMAHRLDQYNTRNWIASIVDYFGTGNLEVGEMAANAKLCISTNIFTTVGKMNAGAKIDYTCQSDGVNTMTLDVTGNCDATAQVVAPHLAMLPCRLSGFKGQVMLSNTDAKTYAMTIDTANGTSAGDYNAVGCVGSGTLAAAPASGTINVTLAGTPQDGEYALARFTSGGGLLAGWTVNVLNLENGYYGGKAVSVVKDTTGLWLQVRTSVPPPTPKDEDGYYLFGKTTEQGGGLTTEDSGKVLVAADWPDFVSYDYPAGSKARFSGYVILDEIPAGIFAEVKFDPGATVFLRSPRAFADGSSLVIPEGVEVTFEPRYDKTNVTDGKYWIHATNSYIDEYTGNLELNGTYRQGYHNNNEVRTKFSGCVTGTGSLYFPNWSEQVWFFGDEFGLSGNIEFKPGYGSFVIVNSGTISGELASYVAQEGWNTTCKNNYPYTNRGLVFGPASSAEAVTCTKELRIGSFNGYARYEDISNVRWRYGDVVIVFGGRRVGIGTLTGGFHAGATREDQSCSGERAGQPGLLKAVTYFGSGEIAVDTMSPNAYIYLSDKVSVIAGSVGANAKFDYTSFSGRVSTSTLTVTNGCAASAQVLATDLAMLPVRIGGFTGSVSLTDTSAKEYAVTIDLSKGTANGDYNVGGCIGSGTLKTAPESGTVNVTLTGEDLVPGDYAIAGFTSGGTLLSGWTVNLVNAPDGIYNPKGDLDHALKVRVVRGQTGLWLRCRKVSGLTVIVR